MGCVAPNRGCTWAGIFRRTISRFTTGRGMEPAEQFDMPISEIAAEFGVTKNSVRTWFTRGLVRNWKRLSLRAALVDGLWLTNAAAVAEFRAAYSAGEKSAMPPERANNRTKINR